MANEMTGLVNKQRANDMHKLFRQGKTFREIGEMYQVSKQAVSELLRRHGYDLSSGGAAKLVSAKRAKKSVERDEDLVEKWGMGYKEYRDILDKGASYKYQAQRKQAMIRGIPWEFTLKTWWDVWMESGKWELRGRGTGKYVMARFGDVGPYHPGNVKIITHNENSSECRARHNAMKA